jgi:hypothetical protein
MMKKIKNAGFTDLKKILLLILISSPCFLYAQDAAPGSLLPDIDPQDIEIRGDFVARFPGIMRQPILGFSPRPRVFQIDPNRMPFIESPEQVVASLPLSELDRPSPPSFSYYRKPEKFSLWSTTGIGNYMAPEVDIFLGIPITHRTKVSGRVQSVSSGSYLDGTDQTSSFRNLDGGLNLIHYSGKRSRWDLGFTGRSDKNHLPIGLFLPDWNGLSVIEFLPIKLAPDNNIHSYGSNLGYRFNKNQFSFWDVGIEATAFGADVKSFSLDPDGDDRYKVTENRFGGAIRKDIAGGRPGNVFSIQLGAQYADYDLDGNDDSWYVGNAGLLYSTRIGYRIKSTIGGRVFYSSDVNSDGKMFIYPELSVSYELTPELSIKGDIKGFANNLGLQGHSKVNRRLFAYSDPETERGVQVSGLVEYKLYDGLRTQSSISYTKFTRHAYYRLDTSQPGAMSIVGFPENNLLTYSYLDGADVIKWDASVWYDLLPSVFSAYAGIYAQWHGDKNGDEIPFRENIGLSAGGTYAFTPRARVHIWSDFTGSRKVGPGRDDVGGYVLLNAKFDFFASKEIGAYIKVTNIMDQRYTKWVGYEELPAQVFGGIMIKL